MALSAGGRGQTGGLSEYAARVGKDQSNISKLVKAAEVAEKVGNVTYVLNDKTAHLSSIHALPQAAWQSAVDAMLAGDKDLLRWATEIKVRAERKSGELLAEMQKATGAAGIGPIAVAQDYRNGQPPTLADLNITKTQSSRWQH